MVFRKASIFLLVLFFSFSVFAGVLKLQVFENDDGVHGSKIIVSWFQGDDTLGLGPDQCGFNGIPGDDVPYVFKDSDSSFYPNVDSDITGCNYCGGNVACNEGLDPGVEDYYCNNIDGSCNRCSGACSSNADCGTGYSCDTSLGSCNAECVCDPALCSGSVCTNTASGSVETVYGGCSNGVCTSHTVTYECPDCQNKVTVCIYYRCDVDGNNCVETSRDVGASCPSDCGYVYETYSTTCSETTACP